MATFTSFPTGSVIESPCNYRPLSPSFQFLLMGNVIDSKWLGARKGDEDYADAADGHIRPFLVGVGRRGRSLYLVLSLAWVVGLDMRVLVTGGAGFIGSHLVDSPMLEVTMRLWCCLSTSLMAAPVSTNAT